MQLISLAFIVVQLCVLSSSAPIPNPLCGCTLHHGGYAPCPVLIEGPVPGESGLEVRPIDSAADGSSNVADGRFQGHPDYPTSRPSKRVIGEVAELVQSAKAAMAPITGAPANALKPLVALKVRVSQAVVSRNY